MEIIPLFKSHYSIGKSIFTIDQIIAISKNNNLEKVFLVEDSLIGFPESDQKFSDNDIQLIFGLRINYLNSIGFVPFEVGEIHHIDNIFVQIDIFFLKKEIVKKINNSNILKILLK